MQAVQVADELRARLTPVVSGAGYDLDDLTVTSAGKRRLVRLTVDKDGGVTLDECAEVSRLVSPTLDAAEDLLGPQSYTLEVSSRGVSRPLTLPRHWRRNAGRLVRVTRTDKSSVSGRITRADEDGASLDVDGSIVEIGYGEVAKAVVQAELSSGGREEA